MDRERFSRIAHEGIRHWNPVPVAVLDAVPERLGLAADHRVLDVGCGRAALLLDLVERTGAEGSGVDASAAYIEAAREAAWERGLEDRVTLVAAPWSGFDPGPDPRDLVVCIGSTHAFGGFEPALAEIHDLLRPGGRALVGEGYWKQSPDPEYLAFLGSTEDELAPPGGNAARAAAAGYDVIETHPSSPADWAAYEDRYHANVMAHLAQHPDDPDAEAMRARITGWRDHWLRFGRDTFGFELLVLRRPVGPAA